MATFDQSWNRNFRLSTKEELDKDTPINDKIKIKWHNESFMQRERVSTLIITSNRAHFLMNSLLSPIFQKYATIMLQESPQSEKSQFIESKHSTKIEIMMNNEGIKQILESNSNQSQMPIPQNRNNNKPQSNNKILFIKCDSIDLRYSYCVCEFLTMHFRPIQVICLDTLERGKYVQNNTQLSNDLPLLRKLHNSHFIQYITYVENDLNQLLSKSKESEPESVDSENKQEEKDTTVETKGNKNEKIAKKIETELIENSLNEIKLENEIKYLETGNLVTSLGAAMFEKCEVREISCGLYLCVTDLDFLGETLSLLGNVIIQKCPIIAKSLKEQFEKENKNGKKSIDLKQLIHKKCCHFASQNGHLSAGLGMFM